MKVITLSKTYMKGHYREGEATNFKYKFLEGSKIHTIRANKKGYFKDGEELSVREWSGKPYASKQVEIGTTTIGIENLIMSADNGQISGCRIQADNFCWVCDWLDLAVNDGLGEGEFFDWFFPKGDGFFMGDILHFTNFRYAGEFSRQK